MVEFFNPGDIHAPVGNYTHTVAVPPETELIFVSGQVGIRLDGSTPATFTEQAEVVFENLRACLSVHSLGMESVVKLNTYIVVGQDVHAMRQIRQLYFGTHRPTSTAVYVPALVSPEFLIEIEAVAVKRSQRHQ